MSNRILASLLKLFVVLLGIVGMFCFIVVIPLLINEGFNVYPFIQWMKLPLFFGIAVAAVFIYLALFVFWKICGRIQINRSFCQENAKGLKLISFFALMDTFLCIGYGFTLMVFNALHPLLLFISVGIVLIGLLIAIASYTLAYLVTIAEKIQIENELVV